MYESFFGLIRRPFQLSPDPEFFFSSQGHKRALSYLQYGLSQGEGFIVVTGEVGTGKTTLMRNLLKTVHRDNIIAAQLVTTKLEADDLLRMICSSFGMPAENKSKAILLQQFQEFLRSAHQANKRVLLVVDEAQNLPASAIEELRMLSNFQTTDTPLLQSFLLGQPELRDIIQDPSMEQFRQRIIASCHLKPLNANELKEYIIWRLTVAGWMQSPRISDLAFSQIFHHTAGVPRRINIFCDRLLLYAYLEELAEITEEVVTTVGEELVDEISFKSSRRAAVVTQPTAPAVHEGAAPATANGQSAQKAELLKEQLIELNDFLSETIQEKVDLIRQLDNKLKGSVVRLTQKQSNAKDL